MVFWAARVFSWEHLYILTGVGIAAGLYLVSHNFLQERTRKQEALARIGIERKPGWRGIGQKLRELESSLDRLFSKLLGKGPGYGMVRCWQESGLGQGPTGLLVALCGIGFGGFYSVYALTGRLLLGFFSAAGLTAGFTCVVFYRADLQRKKFQDQFSSVVERLADSLQAGYTIPQAVHFVAPNLLEPSSQEMHLVDKKLEIGIPLAEALDDLYQRYSTEDLILLIEILKLHQNVGGDIVKMFRELAEVIRERSALKKEIRTLTAQGRLSAVVITLLVPISLAVLAFFPGYIDVLFHTTPGNLVLITAAVLDGLGAFIVRKLIQIEV